MSDGARPDDAALIEQVLEGAAEQGGDITPLVFARFFAIAPEAEGYFQLETLDPQARGRMLAEMLTMLVDQARGEGYVAPALATIAADHVAYGVTDHGLYASWLVALTDVVRALNGPAWTARIAGAWERQCRALLAALAHRRAAVPTAA